MLINKDRARKESMGVIYETSGAAREYTHLAINTYHGCRFACKYCYAPAIARKSMAEWCKNPQPKANILQRIEADAKKMYGDPRPILLCFTSDPYQDAESAELTRKTLLILEKYKLTATVLTKAGMNAVQDFDILKRNGWEFGTTLSYVSGSIQKEWEPYSAHPADRVDAIMKAHSMGIKTWVSVEPVMDTSEALKMIYTTERVVDFWKIGKMNHRKLNIDWKKFHDDAVVLLDSLGAKYYIKKELAAFA